MARIGLGLTKVRGRSMEPTLHTGDRLLVVHGAPPVSGRLAIVQLPPTGDGSPRPLSIKRITGRDPSDASRFWIEADNQRAGGVVDSWTLGHGLAREAIHALVLLRLPARPLMPGQLLRAVRRRLGL